MRDPVFSAVLLAFGTTATFILAILIDIVIPQCSVNVHFSNGPGY